MLLLNVDLRGSNLFREVLEFKVKGGERGIHRAHLRPKLRKECDYVPKTIKNNEKLSILYYQ
jgi:hypothetical protein